VGEAHDPSGKVLARVDRLREVVCEIGHRALAHHDAGARVGGVAERFERGHVGKRRRID
jgi:hypothetical protein